MPTSFRSRFPGSCLILLGALLAPGLLRGQAAQPIELDPVVTTATRTPAPVRTLGTATEVITAAELARRQVNSFAEALGLAPGAIMAASGAPGGITSLFLRGTNSNQTLFLVDGLRLNDPNTDYAVFLGGACVGACDSLEIAHGPQSTLYGGEAMGGVIALRAQRGAGAPTAAICVEAGSFGTVQGRLMAQGERGANAYAFSVQGGHTDNERVNNAFDSANVVLRLDRNVNERTAVGGTLRWFHGVYGSPGPAIGFGANDPDNEERESNLLATVFAEFAPGTDWRSRIMLGGQHRRFVAESPGAGGTAFTVVKNRRGVLDWQNTYTGRDRHRVTAGLTAEANRTVNTGFGDVDESQELIAFFVQDEFTPVDNVFLTAGLRRDDFDTFGRATTGRATAAWLVTDRRLKLRATHGTAFRSPGFLDLYGQSPFYVGNPGLRPEKSRGWDAGFDYYLADNRGTVSATWFENRFRDLIIFDFGVFPGTTANVERARTRGLELKTDLTLPAAATLRLAYTYLEADNLTQNIRLLRRPRHSGNADLWRDFGGGFSAGAGVRWAAKGRDVHAATFATIDAEDYAVARLYAAWQVHERLTLRLRVENLFDEDYAEVHGYPQPGRGAFAGMEWWF
ncbi:MAG: Vitamin transporter BtuB precursor [Verrucomicrobiota bacterium]